jgi:hypothetical protein
MVVQQRLEIEEDKERDEETSRPYRLRVRYLNWVKKIMDGFMIRGTHSPIQWILDLRTYEIKIHFNTTADGYID